MPSATRVCHRCESTSHELRAKTAINGAIMVAYQCLHCGHKHGNWIQHATLPMPVSTLPRWDESLADAYYENKHEERAAKDQQLTLLRQQFDAQWWADYNAYLNTPKWQSLRAKVLERDGGWCRGCGDEPATQVHHLTYKHVRAEFLWELQSVCDACHDRIHRPSPAGTK
jgi:hypothetical protein